MKNTGGYRQLQIKVPPNTNATHGIWLLAEFLYTNYHKIFSGLNLLTCW